MPSNGWVRSCLCKKLRQKCLYHPILLEVNQTSLLISFRQYQALLATLFSHREWSFPKHMLIHSTISGKLISQSCLQLQVWLLHSCWNQLQRFKIISTRWITQIGKTPSSCWIHSIWNTQSSSAAEPNAVFLSLQAKYRLMIILLFFSPLPNFWLAMHV